MATLSPEPTSPKTPPADGRCVWDKLPAELKDIIYERAYVPTKPIKPLSKFIWTYREAQLRQKHGEDYWPGRFFTIVEQRFLVSRAWCRAALKIFYKHAEFYLEDDDVLYHFLADMYSEGWPRPYAERIVSIVVPIGIHPDEDSGGAYQRDPDVTADCLVRVVNACPALTRLKVRATYSALEEDLRYLEDPDREGDIDWRELHDVDTLSSLYGITHLSIEPIIPEDFECPNFCTGGVWRCKECRKRPYVVDTREGVQQSFKMIENLLRPKVAQAPPNTDTGDEAGVPDAVSPGLLQEHESD